MATLTLPKKFAPAIGVAVVVIAYSISRLTFVRAPELPLLLAALVASAFLADVVTSCFHFGFDYVFPYDFPVLGPISREFNEHHDAPTLDPGNYVENLTKGSYASLLVSLVAIIADRITGPGRVADFAQVTLVGLSVWTLFFHQMHSYAHMGSSLAPEVFHRTIAEISEIADKREQRRRLKLLFETVPIPPLIRFMQTVGLTLDPKKHNLHHVKFESDFSSVNGWSDPVLNPIFGPLARRLKGRRRGVS